MYQLRLTAQPEYLQGWDKMHVTRTNEERMKTENWAQPAEQFLFWASFGYYFIIYTQMYTIVGKIDSEPELLPD